MAKSFIPPDPGAIAIGATKLVLPVLLKKLHLQVVASAKCVSAVRTLAGCNTVLLLNHSDRFDPLAAFALSKCCGDQFLYLAARELFNGFQGRCLQKCGAYSVMRGAPEDLESREATISLIVRGDRKLVMFPEGDVTGRDDEIQPLKEDGILNMFEAQSRLITQNKPVTLLPVTMYYQVQDDALEPMMSAVRRLESLAGVNRWSLSLESRLARVMAAVLDQVEDHYGVSSQADAPPDYRLRKLVRHVTLALASYNGIDIDEDQSEHVLLYSVRGQIERLRFVDTCGSSDFSCALQERALKRAAHSVRELAYMQQLLILATTVQQRFTLEAGWRIIDRLEELVTGKTSAKGNRIVWIDSGKPLELTDLWSCYCSDRYRAVSMVDRRVRTSLLDTMHQLQERKQRSLIAL